MAGIKLQTDGVVTVTTAGTAVQWSASNLPDVQSLIIQADPGNTGNLAIGDSTVVMSTGIVLVPGEKLGIDGLRRREGNDGLYLQECWVNAASSGDKLRIMQLHDR